MGRLKSDENIEAERFLNNPELVFHYTKKETAIEHILENSTLRFGGFRSTNDPQDYRRRLSEITGIIPRGDESQRTIEKKNIKRLRTTINDKLESAGFLSFCKHHQTPNQIKLGCTKPRMWSQYGESHKGICLAIDKSILTEKLREFSVSDFQLFHGDIEYLDQNGAVASSNLLEAITSKDIYESNFKYDERILEPDLTPLINEYFEVDSQRLLFTKDQDYVDEHEYRIVMLSTVDYTAGEGLFIDISEALKAVVLGEQFPTVYRTTVAKQCQNLSIPCYQLEWGNGVYFHKKVML
ncbi:DUF2971 domain-containing protein [Shewanella sp. UCD-KL21]|uniref:DUF2971 domain-containing protein n=1 Tax=Shewanella sp. UCD-KL21 TaxID=1917164 RepID=UPI000970EFBA|nr:DUF2971 domain-containing protein [Shewanella sp. UCD-KL21]